jgi:hypothetical protein
LSRLTRAPPRSSSSVEIFHAVYESYFGVKNVVENNTFVWIKSSEDVAIVSLPDCKVTNTYKGVWELEDGSRVVDPIQSVVMKKPNKILFLLKAKAESPTLANKIIIKALDLEKGKFKFYETEKLIPNCKILITKLLLSLLLKHPSEPTVSLLESLEKMIKE